MHVSRCHGDFCVPDRTSHAIDASRVVDPNPLHDHLAADRALLPLELPRAPLTRAQMPTRKSQMILVALETDGAWGPPVPSLSILARRVCASASPCSTARPYSRRASTKSSASEEAAAFAKSVATGVVSTISRSRLLNLSTSTSTLACGRAHLSGRNTELHLCHAPSARRAPWASHACTRSRTCLERPASFQLRISQHISATSSHRCVSAVGFAALRPTGCWCHSASTFYMYA